MGYQYQENRSYKGDQKPAKYLSKEWFQSKPVVTCKPIEVLITKHDGKEVDKAVKILKRKINEEGVLKEVRNRRYFVEKPVKRRLKAIEARKREHMSID